MTGRGAAGLIAIGIAAASLAGCQIGVMKPRGPVGAAERTILIDSVAIMLMIVMPTIVAILGCAWWYRASNVQAKRRPEWAYSGSIELVVWGIPGLVVLLLGGVAWIAAHELDPGKPLAGTQKPLEIQVVSLDWKWLFIYPDHAIATLNTLILPAGRPVHFTLTSSSVMNAFFIPQLGSMIYTMNGMTTKLNLQADTAGVYHGMSSHFSGEGFADMNFQVHVILEGEFSKWAADAGKVTEVLDASRYANLAKQSSKVAPATWRLGDPHLFHAVAMQSLSAGPGPTSTARPGVQDVR